MLKKLTRKFGPNPLDRIIEKAQKKGQRRFLLYWNRGLGDIALGLYAIVHRIKEKISDAQITFLTRANLHDGFVLLGGVNILVAPQLRRGDKVKVEDLLLQAGRDPSEFDVILDGLDPTHWVSWQRGRLTPLLHWKDEWDRLSEKYALNPAFTYVGAHVQTETNYANWRNWPVSSWHRLFEKCTNEGKKVLLFGFEKKPTFSLPGIVDLRGETSLFELLSIIKQHCSALVVPDSGVSSMIYFLDVPFSLKHISLWGETDMGILKQNVASPNPYLQHIPLKGKSKDITNITPEEVYAHLR